MAIDCLFDCCDTLSCWSVSSGLDYGGLSRELIELLCQKLFNGTHGCFIRLDEDNQQAPVRICVIAAACRASTSINFLVHWPLATKPSQKSERIFEAMNGHTP